MHWSLFALAGIALLIAHGLKLPAAGGRLGAIAAFGAGLLLSAFAIKTVASASGIGHTTDFDRYVNAAVAEAKQDPAQLIVFTGASFSRNGIDPARLTLALNEHGYDYRVISLSIEAASILERNAHLEQFMALSGRTPDVVLIEVAQEFDHRAAYMFGNSKFNARAIEQFDLATTAWTARGLAGGACEGLSGCIKDAGFLGLHAALNLLNVGLIGTGERPQDALAVPSYDPAVKARAPSNPEDAATILAAAPTFGPQWVRAYRTRQRETLLGQGVRAVGYYQPPMLDPAARAYTSGLCLGELAGYLCIDPDNPALLNRLNAPVWFDPSHLLDTGTAIYNAWLVQQLIDSGVLEITG